MCAIERAVMEAYDKTSIQINRCKRILALVDTYVETETASARTDLRKALMEEFEAPAIAPPVAAESVDTEEFREVLNAVVMCKSIMQIQCNALLLEHIDVWGAQQREQGKAEQTAFLKECMDRGQDEFNRKWTEQKERAEKAEARVRDLEEAISTDDRVLRSSVPERWKDCASPVGAVQSYIAELEQFEPGNHYDMS